MMKVVNGKGHRLCLVSVPTRHVTLIARIRDRLREVNAFDNLSSTTLDDTQQQRRATYIYFFILFFACFILITYNSLLYIDERFTITNPSLAVYQELHQQYGLDHFDCPCSRVSITYSSFIDFECDFHPVCESEFISDLFLQKLFEIYNGLNIAEARTSTFTIGGTIFPHFQALRILCNLAQDAFQDARKQYLASSIISASMIDENLFNTQMNTSLTRFQSTLPNDLLSDLQFIRGMFQGNAFVSLYSSNWYPVINNWALDATVYMQPQYYSNCNCLTSSSCAQPSVPFIPGYLVGCTPLESLLASTIECLYEQTCIELLTTYLNLSIPIPRLLNYNETHFFSNATIDSIGQQMFIETCSSNVSYNQFYEQCHPLSCLVTLAKRNSPIFVVTTLFGLYGGLTTALKLIVPFLVFSLYRVIRKPRRILTIEVRPYETTHKLTASLLFICQLFKIYKYAWSPNKIKRRKICSYAYQCEVRHELYQCSFLWACIKGPLPLFGRFWNESKIEKE